MKKKTNQNYKYHAFTLIEMVIVLVIMGILLVSTMYLSGEQIQKVKDKTVKESIIAEMQTRYSRNLWSSSFAWKMYDTMDATFTNWSEKIDFSYKKWKTENLNNTFTDNFEIKYITHDYDYNNTANPYKLDSITLKFTPYKISCSIWEEETSYNNVVIVTRVNNNRDYCFEINQKNCRLMEISKEKCTDLGKKAGLVNL